MFDGEARSLQGKAKPKTLCQLPKDRVGAQDRGVGGVLRIETTITANETGKFYSEQTLDQGTAAAVQHSAA